MKERPLEKLLKVISWLFPIFWFPYIVFFAGTSGLLLVFHVSMWMICTVLLAYSARMRREIKRRQKLIEYFNQP